MVSRSGREIIKGGIDLSDNATVDDLKASIQQRGNLLSSVFCERNELFTVLFLN